MRRPRPKAPPSLHDVEATHIWPKALPGAVVLHVKRDLEQERRDGHPTRRMFIELSISEAVAHVRELGEAIKRAGAMGSQTPNIDSAPPL